MFRHSTNTASFFSVLIVALIFSLSLAGVAAAQTNTSLGTNALVSNTTGINNTAIGVSALRSNTTGNTTPPSDSEPMPISCWESEQRYGYRLWSQRQCQQ